MTHRVLMVAMTVAAAVSARPADLEIDLANRTPGDSVTIPATSDKIARIRIVNRIPLVPYTVTVKAEIAPIRALDAVTIPTGIMAAGCAPLMRLADELRDKDKKWTEASVGQRTGEIRSQMDRCSDAEKAQLEGKLSVATEVVEGPFEVARGTRMAVTVSRMNGQQQLTWTTILEGPSRGRWLTTYGVAAVEDSDERFFSKAGADDKFTVTQETTPEGFKVIPSVYFMWLPGEREAKNFSHGPTAGFGIKNDQPAFFVGYAVLYNWNVGLVAGAALVRETRLKGQYQLDQELMGEPHP